MLKMLAASPCAQAGLTYFSRWWSSVVYGCGLLIHLARPSPYAQYHLSLASPLRPEGVALTMTYHLSARRILMSVLHYLLFHTGRRVRRVYGPAPLWLAVPLYVIAAVAIGVLLFG